MYAIIKDGKIAGGANDVATAEWAIKDGGSFVLAPEDFKIFDYTFINGELIKKTDQYKQDELAIAEVQHQRKLEYPPIEEYIDGVVKGDQAQIDAYIAACLAVKNKYPKP